MDGTFALLMWNLRGSFTGSRYEHMHPVHIVHCRPRSEGSRLSQPCALVAFDQATALVSAEQDLIVDLLALITPSHVCLLICFLYLNALSPLQPSQLNVCSAP